MGTRLRQKKQGWGARVRFGEDLGRDEWIALDLPHDQEPLARDRLHRLQVMGKRLSLIGKHAEARLILEEAGATASERGFRAIEQMVEKMSPERTAQPTPKTFRQVVQELCDGALHELYPDEIKRRTKKGSDTRRQQLSTFFPVLGDKCFADITRDDILEAKRLIPKDSKQSTRIRYLRELSYVLKRAVEPLGLCESVPVVGIPADSDDDVFQLIYPDEEEQVAGCLDVTFEERFLYAYLARNGPRITETLQVTWDHCDLERGVMKIAKAWTKTKRARYWDLEPDVLEALRLRRKQIPDSDLIFIPPAGRKFSVQTIWHWLGKNLRTAQLTRPDLFSTLEGERPFTTHDWRASFVTIARAIGMPDRWIRDRSGHESADILEDYDRGVRHARSQGLTWWAPMAVALKMQGAKEHSRLGRSLGSSGPKLVQSWSKTPKPTRKNAEMSFRGENAPPSSDQVNARNSTSAESSFPPSGGFGPAQMSTLGQSQGGISADQLQRLHDLAARAKQWDLVAALGLELEARSQAEAPNVSSLVAARARRDRGEL